MRVFFDTNVLIAAFLTEGVCRRLVRHARDGTVEGILSEQVLEEMERKLLKDFLIAGPDVRETLSALRERFMVAITPAVIPAVCRDSSDDPILAAAAQAGVDLLVTGDKDLLVLGTHSRVDIVHPATLLKQIERQTKNGE